MPVYLRRDGLGKGRGEYRILMNSKHIGLGHQFTKVKAKKKEFLQPPHFLQEAANFFHDKEEDVFDVLDQLEKAALLTPDIGRAEIILRTIRDPFHEDPNFQADGYIFATLCPIDPKKSIRYFRILAFQWKWRKPEYWRYWPYKVRIFESDRDRCAMRDKRKKKIEKLRTEQKGQQ